MSTYLIQLPEELLCVIGLYLNYDDYDNLINSLFVKLKGSDSTRKRSILEKMVRYNPKLTCEYSERAFEEAYRIPFAWLNPNTKRVPESILLELNSPEDFQKLTKLPFLMMCNFVLPHNKYESIAEFKTYLNIFFDALVQNKNRGYYIYKNLIMSIFFSSDYHKQLGIILDRGFVELINSRYILGITDKNIRSYDFLVNMIKEKVDSSTTVGYNLHSDDEGPYFWENNLTLELANKGILPSLFGPKDYDYNIMLAAMREMILEGISQGDPAMSKFEHFQPSDDDFLCVYINYKDKGTRITIADYNHNKKTKVRDLIKEYTLVYEHDKEFKINPESLMKRDYDILGVYGTYEDNVDYLYYTFCD